jgi:hypothetical protein
MKLFTKTVNLGQGGHTTSFEVPNGSIAWGAIILAVVQTLGTILGNYIGTVPTQTNDIITNELKKKNFEVQLLQRVLESSDPNDRANSLTLLINLELLEDPYHKVIDLAQTPAKIPKWEVHPLESINWGTEPNQNSNPLNNQQPNKVDTSKSAPMQK